MYCEARSPETETIRTRDVRPVVEDVVVPSAEADVKMPAVLLVLADVLACEGEVRVCLDM